MTRLSRLTALATLCLITLAGCNQNQEGTKMTMPPEATADALSYCDRQIHHTLTMLAADGNIDYAMMPRNILAGQDAWNLRKADPMEWCGGFWPGVLWYDYEATGDTMILHQAQRFTEALSFLAQRPAYDHDLGFLVIPSFINGYRLTGDERYRQILLACADTLATLFNPSVGTILSWPRHVRDYGGHNTIIDNMLNLELLFWAARNGGDQHLRQIAISHADTTMAYQFRPDHTCAHVAVYDTLDGHHLYNCIHRWDDFDPLSFGTDEFIKFCHTVVAEPQIVVPIGYHNYSAYAPDLHGQEDWLKRALDWLEYCNGDTTTTWGRKRALGGHPEPYGVKYWEIDNEVWKMDPHLYAQLTRIFSLAMKAKDPSIKIIGCGSGRLGAEGKGLDSIMIHEVGEYIDYVSPHHYQDINKFGNEGVEEYGRYLDQLATWIDSSRNPSMKIFLSEWNLSGTDMRTGLFAGGFLNRIERTPHLAMAAPALFLRHLSAPGWDNAFINFDQDRWFPAPNYVVMKLWREHYLPIRIAHDGNLAGLNISATRSENCDSLCVKIFNPGSKDISLDLLGISDYSHSTWEVVMADSLTQRNTLEVPDALRPLPRKVKDHKGVKSIVVPPYSASVLTCLR